MRIRNHRPALVIACLAIVVSLSGVGYAASELPRNSVGTAQVRNEAIVSSKIKDRSLLRLDVAVGGLPAAPEGAKGEPGDSGQRGEAGAAGPAGTRGQTGAQGPRGPSAASGWTFRTAEFSIPFHKPTTKAVTCPAGTKALGGGVTLEKEHSKFGKIRQSGPFGLGAGWRATVTTAGSAPHLAHAFVWVLCSFVS
jgi:hypothetical protein